MRSLVAKFTILCGIILALTTTFLISLNYMTTVSHNHEQASENSLLITTVFTQSIAEHVSLRDQSSMIDSQVETFSNRREISNVIVTDPLGYVLAASDDTYEIGSRIGDPLLQSAIGAVDTRQVENQNLIRIAEPIFFRGRLAGAAVITIDRTAISRSADDLLFREVLLAIGTLLVFLPIVAFAVRQSLGPIKTLTDAARLASSRKLDLRISVNTGDELEVLANAFNRMFSRLEASVKRIQRLAYVDMVTELPNRERFRKELDRVTTQAADNGNSGAVLFLDLDRFKRVNDSLGIGEGDRLLEAVARRLREAARAWDLSNDDGAEPSLVARLGGDEFTLLLPSLRDPSDAARVARRVVDAVRRPFEISGHQVFLGLSVGVALFPRDAADPETLLRHADLAMATAKRNGGNSYEFFESKMNQSAFERLVLENELREAVRDDQLVVYYQPKMTMQEGRYAGCEALVRWMHPTAGLLSPGAFIEAAEECGLIGEIGNYVLRKACFDFTNAPEGQQVAINVSAMQFESPDFAETVMSALEESGLDPSRLELELTESVAMRDPERVIEQIKPLREMGVTFAIDDFGTGHSSLSYLTRMPFDVFKIDQSFVRDMENDPHARIVVETILAMAKSLKLKTVAEGVETTEQLSMLRDLGATLAQGYLFGRPMPLEDLLKFADPKTENANVKAVG